MRFYEREIKVITPEEFLTLAESFEKESEEILASVEVLAGDPMVANIVKLREIINKAEHMTILLKKFGLKETA